MYNFRTKHVFLNLIRMLYYVGYNFLLNSFGAKNQASYCWSGERSGRDGEVLVFSRAACVCKRGVALSKWLWHEWKQAFSIKFGPGYHTQCPSVSLPPRAGAGPMGPTFIRGKKQKLGERASTVSSPMDTSHKDLSNMMDYITNKVNINRRGKGLSILAADHLGNSFVYALPVTFSLNHSLQ